jgi:hypothetical protein
MIPNHLKAKALQAYYFSKEWRTQPYTITYLENADSDTWIPEGHKPDQFNDIRILWQPANESIVLSVRATTQPSPKASENPMNSNGTFQIELDTLFKECWQIGRHITRSSNQLSLIQCDTLIGRRDKNKDNKRVGDKAFTDGGGVNQHTTGNDADTPPPTTIGGWSYGCLVGRSPSNHYRTFMPTLQGSGQKKFDTAVLDGQEFYDFCKKEGFVT